MIPRRRYEFPPDLAATTARAIAKGTLSSGTSGDAFEAALSDLLGDGATRSPALRLCGSGRDALRLLLRALDVPTGSTVILPAYTFAGVADLLRDLGYRVVLCDVGRRRPAMTVRTLAAAWRPETRCVLWTHLFGAMPENGELASWVRDRGAVVIEDCAHALGALDEGRPAGHRGDGAFFSFDLLKPINTFGGGAARLNAPGLHLGGDDLRAIPSPGVLGRVLAGVAEDGLFAGPWLTPLSGLLALPATRGLVDGADRRLRRRRPPALAGLSNLQAQIGVSQALSLSHRLRRRRRMARRVLAALELHDPQLEETAAIRSNAYFTVVKAASGESAARLRWALWSSGIDAGLGADVADDLGGAGGLPLPGAADWFRRALQLPGGASYSDRQIGRLCRRLRRFRGRLVLDGVEH